MQKPGDKLDSVTLPGYGTVKVHEAANLFPLMVGEEFDELVADIKLRGLMEPVVLWRLFQGDKFCLIDGRNRYLACKAAGKQILVKEYPYTDDAIGYIISLNMRRRQLSRDDKSFIALELEKLYTAEAKERQKRKPVDSVGTDHVPTERDENARAAAKAAKAMGVSRENVQQAKAVAKVPALVKAVKAKKITMAKAAAQARGTPEPGPEVLLLRDLNKLDRFKGVLPSLSVALSAGRVPLPW